MKGYWNRWSAAEVKAFFAEYGYKAIEIVDDRTKGEMELVVGKPYYWSWLLAVKEK